MFLLSEMSFNNSLMPNETLMTLACTKCISRLTLRARLITLERAASEAPLLQTENESQFQYFKTDSIWGRKQKDRL
jgi:hypothetical protein